MVLNNPIKKSKAWCCQLWYIALARKLQIQISRTSKYGQKTCSVEYLTLKRSFLRKTLPALWSYSFLLFRPHTEYEPVHAPKSATASQSSPFNSRPRELPLNRLLHNLIMTVHRALNLNKLKPVVSLLPHPNLPNPSYSCVTSSFSPLVQALRTMVSLRSLPRRPLSFFPSHSHLPWSYFLISPRDLQSCLTHTHKFLMTNFTSLIFWEEI